MILKKQIVFTVLVFWNSSQSVEPLAQTIASGVQLISIISNMFM